MMLILLKSEQKGPREDNEKNEQKEKNLHFQKEFYSVVETWSMDCETCIAHNETIYLKKR